jgi:hypothetical protein
MIEQTLSAEDDATQSLSDPRLSYLPRKSHRNKKVAGEKIGK